MVRHLLIALLRHPRFDPRLDGSLIYTRVTQPAYSAVKMPKRVHTRDTTSLPVLPSILLDSTKARRWNAAEHFRRSSPSSVRTRSPSLFALFFLITLLPSILVPQDVDLTSYHLRRKRAALRIWGGDRPALLGGLANEGTVQYRICVDQVGMVTELSLLSDCFWVAH